MKGTVAAKISEKRTLHLLTEFRMLVRGGAIAPKPSHGANTSGQVPRIFMETNIGSVFEWISFVFIARYYGERSC